MVQPRKTRPCSAERLLMGRKESNQTNKPILYFLMEIVLVSTVCKSTPLGVFGLERLNAFYHHACTYLGHCINSMLEL